MLLKTVIFVLYFSILLLLVGCVSSESGDQNVDKLNDSQDITLTTEKREVQNDIVVKNEDKYIDITNDNFLRSSQVSVKIEGLARGKCEKPKIILNGIYQELNHDGFFRMDLFPVLSENILQLESNCSDELSYDISIDDINKKTQDRSFIVRLKEGTYYFKTNFGKIERIKKEIGNIRFDITDELIKKIQWENLYNFSLLDDSKEYSKESFEQFLGHDYQVFEIQPNKSEQVIFYILVHFPEHSNNNSQGYLVISIEGDLYLHGYLRHPSIIQMMSEKLVSRKL